MVCGRIIELRARVGRPQTSSSPQQFYCKAALLFWLFSEFRCGVPLFIVILVIYKFKNR